MWEDMDVLLELINSIVDEEAEISKEEKALREEEIDWFSRLLAGGDGEDVFLVAEVNDNVIASSEINRQMGNQKHIGVVCIVIKSVPESYASEL